MLLTALRAAADWHTVSVQYTASANGGSPMTLQQLLGITLPIIQAPMAGVQGSALTVAVSNAGGLGSLPCAMLGLDAMRKELGAGSPRPRQR
jgi:NAD(P)H-dependent flavin oxidoreductase YrpB (nitropropane dioxygenase family)